MTPEIATEFVLMVGAMKAQIEGILSAMEPTRENRAERWRLANAHSALDSLLTFYSIEARYGRQVK
jgi:hypothetical protein